MAKKMVFSDISGQPMHNAMPKNDCCGYAGVFLGAGTAHTHWIDHIPYILIVQEVQCPKCGKRGVLKASTVAEAHWPDSTARCKAEEAFAVYAAERALENDK